MCALERAMTTKVEGGYRVIRLGEICNLAALRRDRTISSLALRVYLGSHILAASRLQTDNPRFTVKELTQRIGGASELSVQKALQELQTAKVLKFDEHRITFFADVLPQAQTVADAMGTKPWRPVPLPRYVLRALARHKRPVELIAALAHLIRLLFKKGAQIKNTGLVKASWIASVFSVSERAVCSARQWLIAEKIIIPKEVSQTVLNRFGACFIVQLSQLGKKLAGKIKRKLSGSKPKFADPLKQQVLNKSTSTNQSTKKPAFSGNSGFLEQKEQKPTITNITSDNLHRLSHLEELYKQATEAKWLPECEASLRNFVAAAVRATRVPGNAVKIFVGIVRKSLWHHITQEQEDRALQALKSYRAKKGCNRQLGSTETAGVEARASLTTLAATLCRAVPQLRSFEVESVR